MLFYKNTSMDKRYLMEPYKNIHYKKNNKGEKRYWLFK